VKLSFDAHGKFNIQAFEHILLVDLTGPWNVEFVEQLHLEVIEKIKGVNIDNFGVLLIPRGEALSIKEAINYHIAFIKQAKSKAIAVNLEHSTIPFLTQELLESVYKAAGMEYGFFPDNDSAKIWLEEKLGVSTD
jgi:hypothetical protein